MRKGGKNKASHKIDELMEDAKDRRTRDDGAKGSHGKKEDKGSEKTDYEKRITVKKQG